MNRIDKLTVWMCVAALAAVILMGASQYASGQVPIYTRPQGGVDPSGPVSATVVTATTAFRAPDGTNAIVGYGFTSNVGSGMYSSGTNRLTWAAATGANMEMTTSSLVLGSAMTFGWTSASAAALQAADTILARDAANTLAQKNTANAQTFRIYGTTTGPKYLSLSHDGTDGVIDVAASSGVLRLGTSGASPLNTSVVFNTSGGVAPAFNFQNAGVTRYAFKSGANTQGSQLSITQNAVPTCSSNCGTSPAIVGSDTSMTITMGSSGVPASGWVVTFNGTWAAAPSCIAQSALSTMVVGKMPIAVQTTTTTATVTTNGTAPATSDKYFMHCIGIS